MGSFFFPLKTGHHHHHQIGPNTEHQMQWHESCQCQCLPDCLPRSCKSATHQASIISQRSNFYCSPESGKKEGKRKGKLIARPIRPIAAAAAAAAVSKAIAPRIGHHTRTHTQKHTANRLTARSKIREQKMKEERSPQSLDF